jgi:hypothetical protein
MAREEKGKYLKLSESHFTLPFRQEVVARSIGQHKFYVRGLLEELWWLCQQKQSSRLTKQEIDYYIEGPHDTETLISALCNSSAHYLEPVQNDIYEVVGVGWRLEKMKSVSDGRKKAAQTRWFNNDANALQTESKCNANLSEKEREKEKESEKKKPSLRKVKKSDSPPAQTPPARRKSTRRPLIRTWEPDHPFGYAFTHLQRLSPYRAVFDVPTDNDKLTGFVKEFGFEIKQVNEYTRDFVEYYIEQTDKVKNPRGRLFTWMRNRQDWKRAEKQKPKTRREVRMETEAELNRQYMESLTPEQREKPF